MSAPPAAPMPTDPSGPLALETRAAIRDYCRGLAEGARREVLILSPDLEPDTYDQPAFLAALRRLALAAPRQPVRVLVQDPRAPVTRGHRLLELSRQLSSAIAIRRLGEEFRTRRDAYLVADGRSYCRRTRAAAGTALAQPLAPREARLLQADFEQLWERSDEDVELRRLFL